MPELPEVETIAQGLAKRITGDVVQSVGLGEKPEPLKSSAGEIVATLGRSRIAGVRRMGKHIVFDLERESAGGGGGGKSKSPSMARALAGKSDCPTQPDRTLAALWIVHLGMSGRLPICQPDEDGGKHTHAILRLESG